MIFDTSDIYKVEILFDFSSPSQNRKYKLRRLKYVQVHAFQKNV